MPDSALGRLTGGTRDTLADDGPGAVSAPVQFASDGREEKDGKVYLTADGVRYELPGLEPDDIEELEDYYRANRKAPVEALNDVAKQIATAHPVIRDGLLNRLDARLNQGPALQEVTGLELSTWLDTRSGVKYTTFVQLRKAYPDMTLEKATHIFDRVGLAEMKRLRDKSAEGTALKARLDEEETAN